MDPDSESTLMDASPLTLALRVHADQARTGERLGLIEQRLHGLEEQAKAQTQILAELSAALKPLNQSIQSLASIQSAELELQKQRLAWDQGAPERTKISAGIALEIFKAGGALLLAATAALGGAWAAFWRQ